METCRKPVRVLLPDGKALSRRRDGHGQADMATVSLKNIFKIYDGNVTAVSDFNLEIADKEFIVLVGPSGCGKSTTLRMVAGLEEITKGELRIDDKLVNDVEPKDRDIAMVFQSYALYPHMTVRENMAFPLKLRKMDKAEIARRVNQAAETLDITQYLDRKPKALSGGQRQRVAIGRAIVREPKVLLMDEPLSNLDAKLRNQMRAEIIKLRQRINTTFIYVTHDQTEAMTLGDRIVIMKDGFIQQIGTPQQVFESPVNLFVAGFIGTPQMNFFHARLEKSGEGYLIRCMGAAIPVTADMASKLAAKGRESTDVILGVRPEHISLQADPASSITCTVEVSELMGSEFYLHGTVGEGAEQQNLVMRVQTGDLPEVYRSGVPFGTKLNFTFHSHLVHLFDPATERNLLAD